MSRFKQLDKNRFLENLYWDLQEFKNMSSIEINEEKTWVISEDEFSAIDIVAYAVWDCIENKPEKNL